MVQICNIFFNSNHIIFDEKILRAKPRGREEVRHHLHSSGVQPGGYKGFFAPAFKPVNKTNSAWL